MSFADNLKKIKATYAELEARLASGKIAGDEFAKISKEYSDLGPIVEIIDSYNKINADISSAEELAAEELDAETKEMVAEELINLKKQHQEVEHNLKIALLPKDVADDKSAIIEIRAGTGGEEASLFAADLFLMYQRYAEAKGWKFEVLEISETGAGGYKEAQASIKGKGVFARLKFESGVHRVQRVPETESSGRIHTSAATVAVLPEAEDVDIEIAEKDLRIDTYRSSGAGGQHVNTTDSAVRVTHIPTGIIVTQSEKSQHRNKDKALKILRAKLYELERQKLEDERASERKTQVGSGDRSERIRTYNFPQGRVSDHRINLTLYKINEIVKQGELDEIINELTSADQAAKLSAGDF